MDSYDEVKGRIKSQVLTPDKLEEETTYLIQNFLVPGTVNLLYGTAGSGKSFFTLYLSLYLLENNKVSQVFYLDGDNSQAVLRDRNFNKILGNDLFFERLNYMPRFLLNSNTINELEELLSYNREGHCLIVIDSIRNFQPGDANTDRDTIKFMNTVLDIRDYGHTVILLHHLNKRGHMKNNTTYRDYSECVWRITSEKSNGALTIGIENDKSRVGPGENFIAVLEIKVNKLTLMNDKIALPDREMVKHISALLKDKTKIQSFLIKEIRETYPVRVAKIHSLLNKYKNVIWKVEKGKNNSSHYSLLRENTVPSYFSYELKSIEHSGKTGKTRCLEKDKASMKREKPENVVICSKPERVNTVCSGNDREEPDIFSTRSMEEIPLWKPERSIKAYGDLNIAFMDIETTGLKREGGAELVEVGFLLNEEYTLFKNVRGEKKVLQEVSSFFSSHDIDILCGHNIFSFDILFLNILYDEYKMISPFGISTREHRLNNGSPVKFPWFKSRDFAIVDTYHLLIQYDRIEGIVDSYSLKKSVIQLGLRKEARLELSPERISYLYKNKDFEEIDRYLMCDLEDTELLCNYLLPARYNLMKYLPEKFYIQETVYYSTANMWNSILTDYYGGRGQAEPDGKVRYKGGLCYVKPGLYKKAGKIDISSMYPHIMLLYRLCSRKDRDQYMLRVLKYLTGERLRYKEENRERRTVQGRNSEVNVKEKTLKILINSAYGFLGTSGRNYNDMGAAAAVTAYGRAVMQFIVDKLSSLGAYVIEYDTDGVIFSHSEPERVHEVIENSLPCGFSTNLEWKDYSIYVPVKKNYILYDGKNIPVQVKGVKFRGRNMSRLVKEFPVKYIGNYFVSQELAEEYYNTIVSSIGDKTIDPYMLATTKIIGKNEKKALCLGKVGQKVTRWHTDRGHITGDSSNYGVNYYIHQVGKIKSEIEMVIGNSGFQGEGGNSCVN